MADGVAATGADGWRNGSICLSEGLQLPVADELLALLIGTLREIAKLDLVAAVGLVRAALGGGDRGASG